MRMTLLFHYAARSLLTHRIISLLMVGAVAAGVGFQIPNDANLTGYRDAIRREVLDVGPGSVRVARSDGNNLKEVQATVAAVSGYPGVLAAVPTLMLPGSIGAKGKFRACAVTGVDTSGSRVPFRLLRGQTLPRGDADGVLIGTKYADELGVGPGEQIQLRVVLPSAPVLDPEDTIVRRTLLVRGVVSGAFGARNMVFLDRSVLAEEAGMEDEATSISVYAADPEGVEPIARQIAAQFPETEARAWKQDNMYAKSALDAVEAVSRVSIAMVLAAVAIPVLALLYINVLHRRMDIGILSAIGFDRREIFLCFLLQAVLVGCAAIPLGCAMGWALIAYFKAHPIFQWEGFVLYPTVTAATFVRPSLLVLASTLLAGALPAWFAARSDPARVIRGTD